MLLPLATTREGCEDCSLAAPRKAVINECFVTIIELLTEAVECPPPEFARHGGLRLLSSLAGSIGTSVGPTTSPMATLDEAGHVSGHIKDDDDCGGDKSGGALTNTTEDFQDSEAEEESDDVSSDEEQAGHEAAAAAEATARSEALGDAHQGRLTVERVLACTPQRIQGLSEEQLLKIVEVFGQSANAWQLRQLGRLRRGLPIELSRSDRSWIQPG